MNIQYLRYKLKEEEKIIHFDLPEVFVRFLENRNSSTDRVLEVVLVYNGVDRYDTIIDPEGLVNSPSTILIDTNHNSVHTGAYIDSKSLKVVENYETKDGIILERALIAHLVIPETAEMFYYDKKTGEKKSNGNLKQAVDKGYLPSVSVRFRPVKEFVDTRTGITTFKQWEIIDLALLDEPPGQPHSTFKTIRSYLKTMPKYQKGDTLQKTITATILEVMGEEGNFSYSVEMDGKTQELKEEDLIDFEILEPEMEEPEMEERQKTSELDNLKRELESLKKSVEDLTKTKNTTETQTNDSNSRSTDQDKEDEELARSYKEETEKDNLLFSSLLDLVKGDETLIEKIDNEEVKGQLTRSLQEQKDDKNVKDLSQFKNDEVPNNLETSFTKQDFIKKFS